MGKFVLANNPFFTNIFYKMIRSRKSNLFIPVFYTVAAIYVICAPILYRFSFLDELIVCFLALFGFRLSLKKKWSFYYLFILGLVAYFIYSVFGGANTAKAALLDFILFLKPILCFFIAFLHPYELSPKARDALKKLFGFLGVYCISQVFFLDQIYSNTALYYSCCTVCALSYLYFSDFTKKDIVFIFFVLTSALFSLRAKYFTEFIFILLILLFLNKRIKLNIKWGVSLAFVICLAIYINWDKFVLYFINGVNEGIARSLFYRHIPDVLCDYAPFGPGLGTYNTEGAAQYYSPLYNRYGMDLVWGTRAVDYKTAHDYLHDTFYPALAQFGFCGIIVYVMFWFKIWNLAKTTRMSSYKLFLCSFFVISVENIANNAFTSATGVVYLMLIGMSISSSSDNLHLEGKYK